MRIHIAPLLLALAAAAEAAPARKMSCLGLPNCYQLSNGIVEVVVTTDVGPRIAAYRFAGGENMLSELPDRRANTEFRIWGGHRLWLAPEVKERTTLPDNVPLEHRQEADGTLRLTAPADAGGIQKELAVRLDPEGTGVTVEHRVTNRGLWGVELAPWAITILRGGGTGIIPQEPYRRHEEALLPARSMALWYYTDLADARLTLGSKYLRVRTDAANKEPFKIGVANKQGWMAYHVDRSLFVKRFRHEEGAVYPDLGSNAEIYTQGSFIELESLGPLQKLAPGATAAHVERWFLFKDVALGANDAETESTLAAPLATAAPQ